MARRGYASRGIDGARPAGPTRGQRPAAGGSRHGFDWRAFWLTLAITLAGAALRLSTLNTRSFWLDETTSVRQATWPIPELIARMSDNVHPPLFHLLLHAWIRVFGRSEVAVRMFPVMFGIAAIPLMYWAARTMYDRRTGLLSSGILAFAPFFIWYAQEARMYAMMLVFAIVSTGAMWKAMRTNGAGWWALYALMTACGVMTQYFFAVLVMMQAVFLFTTPVREREHELAEAHEQRFEWKRPWTIFADAPVVAGWLASMAFLALPLLWWVPKVLSHRSTTQLATTPLNYGWQAPTLGIHFNELWMVPVETVFGFHSPDAMRNLVAMWPLLLPAVFLSVGLAGRVSRRTWYLVLTGIGSATLLALLGQWQPVLDARYFTAFLAPIVILTARFMTELRPVWYRLVLAFLVVISVVGWADQSFDPVSIVKWDNRQAFGVVANGWRPGDVVVLVPYFVSSLAEYYLPAGAYASTRGVPAFDTKGNLRTTPAQVAQDLSRRAGTASRVWLIATWQDTPDIARDRLSTIAWLRSNDYKLAGDWKYYRIEVSLYEGKPQTGFFTGQGPSLENSASVGATATLGAPFTPGGIEPTAAISATTTPASPATAGVTP